MEEQFAQDRDIKTPLTQGSLKIRHSHVEDLPRIMEIIAMAVDYMKENHIDQWSENYPDRGRFLQDIEKNESYICQIGGCIAATAALSLRDESNYEKIFEGRWKTSGPYGVIHRIAVDDRFKGTGVAAAFVDHIEKMCINRGIYAVRVDTHRDNRSMDRFLRKHGFDRCGIIYVEDGTQRVAYEKELEK